MYILKCAELKCYKKIHFTSQYFVNGSFKNFAEFISIFTIWPKTSHFCTLNILFSSFAPKVKLNVSIMILKYAYLLAYFV